MRDFENTCIKKLLTDISIRMRHSSSKAFTDYEIKLGEKKRNGDTWDFIDIIDILKKLCKHWTFSLKEDKISHDRYFQCSIRLQKRTTGSNLLKLFCEI